MRVRSRKVLAVLASGVVLLGGGMTTLAAWQDDEFTQVPLNLSSFDVETSLDGTTWNSAENQGTPKALAIAVAGQLTNAVLTPNGTVTAWVGLRAAKDSMPATVTMSGVSVTAGNPAGTTLLGTTVGGGGRALTYQAVSGIDIATCQAGTFSGGTTLVGSGTAVDATVTSSSFTLPAGVAGVNDGNGAAVGVCFRLKLADSLTHALGGASVNAVWKFHATSADS